MTKEGLGLPELLNVMFIPTFPNWAVCHIMDFVCKNSSQETFIESSSGTMMEIRNILIFTLGLILAGFPSAVVKVKEMNTFSTQFKSHIMREDHLTLFLFSFFRTKN